MSANLHNSQFTDEAYEISYRLFENNEILEAPKEFARLKAEPQSELKSPKIKYRKWEILHLLLASDYQNTNKLCEKMEMDFSTIEDSEEKADIQFCLALNKYYCGDFKEIYNLFFPNKIFSNDGYVDILNVHRNLGGKERPYQLGHDHMLLGKMYWKMGYYMQAQLHYYLAILNFIDYSPDCIWISKLINLLGLLYINQKSWEEEVPNLADECFATAEDNLKRVLKSKALKHHLYACLEYDRGLMELENGQTAYSLGDAIKSNNYYKKAKDHLDNSKGIFKEIYLNDKNRFTSTVIKNEQILYKRLSNLKDNADEKETYYKNSEKAFWDDMDIRRSIFFENESQEYPYRHTTIGRCHNIYARLKLQSVDYDYIEHKERRNRASIFQTQMAMACVLNDWEFEGVKFEITREKSEPDKIVFSNPPKDSFDKAKSSNVLLQAFKLKIRALTNLYQIGWKTQEALKDLVEIEEHLEETISCTIKLISDIRSKIVSPIANVSLSNLAKGAYEAILDYYYFKKDKPTTDKKELDKLIFDTFCTSKNYELTQDKQGSDIAFIPTNILEIINLFRDTFFDQFLDTKAGDIKKLIENKDGRNYAAEIFEWCDELRERFENRNNGADKSIIDDLESIDLETAWTALDTHQKDVQEKGKMKYLPSLIVSYFFGRYHIYVMYLSHDGLQMEKVAKKSGEIAVLIKKYQNYLWESDKNPEVERKYIMEDINQRLHDIQNVGYDLYQQILPKFDDYKDSVEFIIFSPDGLLNVLPFDTLYLGPKEDCFLLEKYCSSYHYSLYLLRESIEERRRGKAIKYQKNYIGIGSDFRLRNTGAENNLPFRLVNEILYIHDIFFKTYGDEVISFVEDNNEIEEISTLSRFFVNNNFHNIKEEITDAAIRVLHLATHFSEDTITIHLSGSHTFGKEKIERIKRVNLAFLAGCNTGNGFIEKNFASLSRYFIINKEIQNIVSSIIPIPDEAANEHLDLNKVFFKKLLDNPNRSIPLILNEAKREVLKGAKIEEFQTIIYYDDIIKNVRKNAKMVDEEKIERQIEEIKRSEQQVLSKYHDYRRLVEIAGYVFHGCPFATLGDD